MQSNIAILGLSTTLILLTIENAQSYGCGTKWQWSKKQNCCDGFPGGNCEGPCENEGCQTTCQDKPYFSKLCEYGSGGGHFFCCPDKSSCRPNAASETDVCCDPKKIYLQELSDFKYSYEKVTNSTDNENFSMGSANFTAHVVNYGQNSNRLGKISGSVSQEAHSSIAYSSTVMAAGTVKIKAPKILPEAMKDSSIDIRHEENWGWSNSKSTSFTTAFNFDSPWTQIRPFTANAIRFYVQLHSYKVPFTATGHTLTDCGNTGKQVITGTQTMSGIGVFSESKSFQVVSKGIPVECVPDNFNDMSIEEIEEKKDFCKADKYCKTNPICVRMGIEGSIEKDVCCDLEDRENMHPCCAFAAGHRACMEHSYFKSQLCPNPEGQFDPCCTLKSI